VAGATHWTPCNVPGCGALARRGAGRCDTCRRQADAARGSASQRGYRTKSHARFRRAVLRRDRVCVLCRQAPSEHADHYPVDRRTLVARGQNPDDPMHGRGLCASCHRRETARHQPGGWARQS
jgi:5-methylcytosine-specific restriction enzyme A